MSDKYRLAYDKLLAESTRERDSDADRIEELEAERDRLREAMKWVLNDAAFKAPEQMGDPTIFMRWFDRLHAALNPEGDNE